MANPGSESIKDFLSGGKINTLHSLVGKLSVGRHCRIEKILIRCTV